MVETEDARGSGSAEKVDLSARLARLARSATRLHASLSVQEVVDRVVEEAADLIGAHQGVVSFTIDHDWAQSISSTYLSDRYAAYRDYDEQPRGEGIYRLVCEGNEPMRLTQAELEAHPAWRGFGEAADRHPPMDGWLAAPLVAKDGHNLGLVQLTDKLEGEFTAEDEAVLVQLSSIAAIAIENANVYERERNAAQQLQSELLPAQLPQVAGLSLATRYIPGEQGARVGGDWYDVIALDEDRVAMVVGDVMGRGISAASAMGQLRIGVRAYALEDRSPAEVLHGVDDLLRTLGDYFVTLLYCVWDLRRNSLLFASAGHLPPLLRLPDRRTVFLRGEQGPPVGVEPTEFFNHQVDVPVGSTLMLYTDGLVEHRGLPLGRALGMLARGSAAASEDPDELARDVLASMPTAAGDDVALVVARRAEDPGARAVPVAEVDRRLGVLRMPPNAERASEVRAWVAQTLTSEGLGDLVDTAELLVSEVVANAIVHASTEVELQLVRRSERVRVAVYDAELQLPSVAALDLEATGGRGMYMVDLLAVDWGVYMEPDGKTVWFELQAQPLK